MKTISVCLAGLALLAAACSSDSKSNDCKPEGLFCEENTLRKCTASGTDSVLIKVCEEQCVEGACVSFSKDDALSDGTSGQDLPADAAVEEVPPTDLPDQAGTDAQEPDAQEPDEQEPEQVEPDVQAEVSPCQDACKDGEFYCSGIKVYHGCVKGEDGCLRFDEEGIPCEDGNPCTDDACALGKGCVTADNTEPCDDGNDCTQGDLCGAGQCQPGTNACQCAKDPDCAELDDDDLCNGMMVCQENECVVDPKTVVTCPADPGDPCAHYECAPDTGECSLVPTPQATCDDDNLCTVGDFCDQGQCVGASELICDDKNACTDDSCLPGQGCTFSPANGASCTDDGNACTEDVCSGGACTHPGKPDGTPCGAGMACDAGSCKPSSAPLELAGGLNSPWNLAVDDSNVYFVENDSSGAVKKVAKSGGPVTTLASGLVEPTSIGVDASFVYFIERNNGSNGSLKKVPLGGGGTTTLASGLKNAQNHLAVYGDSVYFGDGKTGGGGVIKKVGINGGETILVDNNGLLNLNTAIDVSGGSVYFKNDYDKILRVATSGGGVTELGSGEPSALKVGGSYIFFTEYSNATVKQMPISGGATTTLATGADSAANLATDGSYVYWTEFNNPGKVARVPIGGGSVKTYSNQANSIGIAVDGQYVYYTVSVFTNQGKVMRALK